MKGLEISRLYFEQFGRPMLEKEFGDIMNDIAVAVCGSGSDCFGFDDEISRDHDFEPGFTVFLPEEGVVDRKTAFELERAYSKLPREFMGLERSLIAPVGGVRRGVVRLSDFLISKTGTYDGVLSEEEWILLPQNSLAETVNGEVFFDPSGFLTEKRRILSSMPDYAVKKRLSGCLIMAGQAGQYNLKRCLEHGEIAASRLAAAEFARFAAEASFLIHGVYMPFYKWIFRSLRNFDADLCASLEELLSLSAVEFEKTAPAAADKIALMLADTLRGKNLVSDKGSWLERLAYSVNDSIERGDIRNLDIFYSV